MAQVTETTSTSTTTETEEEEESQPSLRERIAGFFGAVAGFLRLVLKGIAALLIVVFLATVLSMEEVQTVQNATRATIAAEDRDATIEEADYQLWDNLIRMVMYMQYERVRLEGAAAASFGKAILPPNSEITLKEIYFVTDENRVELTYDAGVNKEVVMELRTDRIDKTLTRYEGFSEGDSIFRFLQWYGWGRFFQGYPRYSCSANMNRSQGTQVGEQTAGKQLICLRPFGRVFWFLDMARKMVSYARTAA